MNKICAASIFAAIVVFTTGIPTTAQVEMSADVQRSLQSGEIPAEVRAQIEAGNIPKGIPADVRAQLEQQLSGEYVDGADISNDAPTTQELDTPDDVPPESGRRAAASDRLFGLDIFRRSGASFTPLDLGPIDPDYRIGSGDEIVIDAWGDVDLRYRLTVDRTGAITVPVVGRIIVSGLTQEELVAHIHQRLARYHESLRVEGTGARSHLSVSLGKLRPITVFILGEVSRPGAYTLGATATLFHSLYSAGGPTSNGSLRRIARYGMDGTVDSLDVYDYLIHGERGGDVRLRHLDVVFVPIIGRTVTVRGAIRRPARYELNPDESLSSLIEYAGGLRPDATPEYSQIERIVGSVRRLIDLSIDEATKCKLNDGDILRIGTALTDVKYTVTASGEVMRPRDYSWVEGMTVADLLHRAEGPTDEAYLKRVEVIRLRLDGTTELIPVDIEPIVLGDSTNALELYPYDVLRVRSVFDFLPPEQIVAHGEVRRPGLYSYHQEMTLADLLFQSGGLTPAAYTREVVIYRQNLTEGQVMTDTLTIALPVTLDETDITTWPTIPLKRNDHVFIRKRPDWHDPAIVTIRGEVQFPGTYQLATREVRLLELIEHAGGETEYAYEKGVHVIREGLGKIATDLPHARSHPSSSANFILYPNDVIVLPREPQTVTIRGAVGLETSVVYEPGKRVGYYLELAGDVLDSADTKRIQLIEFSGRAMKARRCFIWSKVTPGSTIIVPTEEKRPKTDWGETIRNTVTFLGSLAMTTLLIMQVLE